MGTATRIPVSRAFRNLGDNPFPPRLIAALRKLSKAHNDLHSTQKKSERQLFLRGRRKQDIQPQSRHHCVHVERVRE